ncbi:DUF1766-domain-containing protein [Polychaeton citri CBS 116435]|uniref:DUF1766-domain-containing protein n=1 Tax=Polychaeton citri CBS 116435 TaxID=1314669 RepID=A0A9P4QDI5_9PEZI|nr:DUF1766-domain-containing protein [Polychaeton citri CBS 116435]
MVLRFNSPTTPGDRVDGTIKATKGGVPASPPPSAPGTPTRTRRSTPKITKEDINCLKPIPTAPVTPPASPQVKPSTPIVKDKQPSASERRQKVASLRARLGLNSGQCGGLTLKGLPCKRQVRKEGNEKLNPQVESMVDLTQSSPELLAELEKLGALIHCNDHGNGLPKYSRMEQWMGEFPLGESKVKASLPPEIQIRFAIGWWNTQCIGTTSARAQCRVKIGGRKVQNCRLAIAEVVKSGADWEDCSFDEYMQYLQSNMQCHWHVRQTDVERTALWKGRILEILQKAAPKPTDSATQKSSDDAASDVEPRTPRSASRSSSKVADTPASSDSEVPAKSLSPSPASIRELAKTWQDLRDKSLFTIIESGRKSSESRAPCQQLKTVAQSRLVGDDAKRGYIYLYEVEGNPGFVKLGYTTRSVEVRQSEWEFDCNRKIKPLYSTNLSHVEGVQNARRVEALCHEELHEYSTQIYCENCMKLHVEWFEVPSETAIAVIQKWSRWMEGRPYKNGVLNDEWREKAASIEGFMEEVALSVVSDEDPS